MCTMCPADGISFSRRSAAGSARSGVVEASTAWM
jgi:hypothetical protein